MDYPSIKNKERALKKQNMDITGKPPLLGHCPYCNLYFRLDDPHGHTELECYLPPFSPPHLFAALCKSQQKIVILFSLISRRRNLQRHLILLVLSFLPACYDDYFWLDECHHDSLPTRCYCCGRGDDFSGSQRDKFAKARCRKCVMSGKWERHKKYQLDPPIEDQLIEAVSNYDVDQVEQLLLNNKLSPECSRQLREGIGRDAMPAFLSPGVPALDESEPHLTPLEMVVFRSSDSMLDDDAHMKFFRIATLLLEKGASVARAKKLLVARYGVNNNGGAGYGRMLACTLLEEWET
jgi:hypothetical protein